MPTISRHCFGIFFDGQLGGAVVYGSEYGENLGVWDRYGYSGRIIALQRGACAHWAHPHAASKLIRASMRLLPERYAVVTATVDAMAGEIGTIYQAAGFDYVGVMHPGRRALIKVSGRTISERRAGLIAGTQGRRALAALGFVPPLCPVGRDLPVSRIAHRAQGPAARDCAPDPALSSEDRRQSMARGSVLILQACSALQRTPIRYPQRYPTVIVR